MILPETILLFFLLLAGFYMAWSIGANDVANAMGTSVGSSALSLRSALILAAVFEFLGAFFFGAKVTETIQSGILIPTLFDGQPLAYVFGMLSALLSAAIWLQIASYFGWPVSTTHAIIGAVVGFGIVLGGVEAVNWLDVSMIVSSWILSPLLGGVVSYYIFTFLRDRIFLSAAPFEQAKKWAPFFFGGVVLILSMTLIFSSQDELLHDRSIPKMAVLSLLIAVAAGVLSMFWMKTIGKEAEISLVPPEYQPEVLIGLGKVKKHLSRLSAQANGDIQGKVIDLLGQVDKMSAGIRQVPVHEVIQSHHNLVEKIFLKLQVLTACLMAFAHGSNDVANAIGPLVGSVQVLSTKELVFSSVIPSWALLLGGLGIVIGLATWGWRVILTIGKKITELTPTRGFSAEFSAALVVLCASRVGLPVSATHTLVGAVLGVGIARGLEAINLSITRDILISWVITVPIGASLSAFLFYLFHFFFL